MVCVISLRRRQTLVIEDTESHPLWEPWKHLGRKGGFRALVASPLSVAHQPVGVLMAYRREAGPWPPEAEAWLKLASAHIASAVRLGQLLDERRRRLAVLARVAEGLHGQTLEHLKSLETLAAMLEPGAQPDSARLIAQLEGEHQTTGSAIEATIQHRILAGLLIAEVSIAQQRGIRLELDPRSKIAALPGHLAEADAVSIVSNLLDNAFDAVQDVEPARRRVRLLVRRREAETVIRVRDWGVGLGGLRPADLVSHGYSTKPAHCGAGLALVADIVAAADGRLEVQGRTQGAEFVAAVPNE
jgi:sensor histidine kinase regulating citrate/malate metabolism